MLPESILIDGVLSHEEEEIFGQVAGKKEQQDNARESDENLFADGRAPEGSNHASGGVHTSALPSRDCFAKLGRPV